MLWHFSGARAPFCGLFRDESYASAFPEGCQWAGRRPIGSVDIDLDRDDCEQIASKLERWERIEGLASYVAP